MAKTRSLDQARAVVTFLDAASEKTLRSTVALTAARGRGKSAGLHQAWTPDTPPNGTPNAVPGKPNRTFACQHGLKDCQSSLERAGVKFIFTKTGLLFERNSDSCLACSAGPCHLGRAGTGLQQHLRHSALPREPADPI